MYAKDWLDQLSDHQLITVYNQHAMRFERAWVVCMRNHYSSGAYIDCSRVMDRESLSMKAVDRYVYDNRPAAVYDQLQQAAIVTCG